MKFSVAMVAIALSSVAFLQSCKKDDNDTVSSEKTATVNMHLTDDPAVYDAVWINIQKVEVTMEGHSAVSIVPIRPGMYNLLTFRNGLDTLLLRATVPAGKVSQIRLILGEGNYVVVDGQVHDLNTPSAQESGLKLNLKDEFIAGGAYDVWIDFDAGKSIHETGNGKYQLKPVIRAYTALTDGRVKGFVLPASALTMVYLSNGTDAYAAIPGPDGYFIFTGVPEGTYSVTFDATVTSFQDITVNNVVVKYGTTVDLGITTLVP
jgi:hypothetical protein